MSVLPPLIEKLFDQEGFGEKLRAEIIPYLDASILKTGKINPNLIPDLAYNILYRVDTEAQMLTLTTDNVQNYDFVLVGNDMLYMVLDDTNLNSIDSYLFLLSLKNFSGGNPKESEQAIKLKNPISISLTGAINVTQSNWNGTSNIELNIESIDPNYCFNLNKVIRVESDFTITQSNLNNIICVSTAATITLNKIEMNGWNCFIKNISSNEMVTIESGTYIDTVNSIKLAPRCVVKLVSDGNNFISIDNTPTVIFE